MDEMMHAAESQQSEDGAALPQQASSVYQNITLSEAESYIEGNLVTTARAYVATGYFLKRIRNDRLYEEDGYKNFDEYVRAKYGKGKDWASKAIKVNNKLSVNGDSPHLGEEYKGYTTYQLVELAYMTEEQREQATPEQTVKELREIRKPKEIPYFEMKGQLDLGTDFPEVAPEEQPRPQIQIEQEEIPEPPQEPTTSVEGLASGGEEKVATSQLLDEPAVQEKTGICIHRSGFPCTLSELAKQTAGDGEDCSNKCCWNCIRHGGNCRIECYASAGRLENAAEMQKNEPEGCGNRSEEGEAGPELSAYGTQKKIYPEGSMIATEGCEGRHACFSCAMECQIRQADRYCQEAPMGNPFPCEHLVLGLKVLEKEIGNKCQFINHDLAYHRSGDGEPDPCCKSCDNPCEYICERAMKKQEGQQEAEKTVAAGQEPDDNVIDAEENAIDADYAEVPEKDDYTPQYFLKEQQEKLDEILEVFKDEDPEKLPKKMIARQKIVVAALASMVCDLENAELEKQKTELEKQMQWPRAERPELPVMKNDDQRKEFLDTFHDWPVWFRVREASEVYYRYDLPDRTALVICEYHYWMEWKLEYSEDPECVGTREYLLTPGYHYLRDCQSNRSAMIEKLKGIQKK